MEKNSLDIFRIDGTKLDESFPDLQSKDYWQPIYPISNISRL